MDPVDHLMQIFATAGARRYDGEEVSQLEHARQAAVWAQPYAEAAVRLRRWDEAAKVPGARTPDLESFRTLLNNLATGRHRGA